LQQVVVAGLRRMGYQEEAERSVHFAYEMVALSPACARALGFELEPEEQARPYVEISGRKGLGVKADDLIDRLLEKARIKVGENFARAGREASPAELEATAEAVAVGALRYYLVKFGRTKVIAFDLDEALAFEGETGPYLLYALVRMRSIFAKLREHGMLDASGPEALLEGMPAEALEAGLDEDETWDMVRFAAQLESAAAQAVSDLELSQLAKWCFVLAQKFSNFYHHCPILQESDPLRRAVRVLATWAVARQLECALGLLGVRVPERM
jgi:arginyl-tRNA synthetase